MFITILKSIQEYVVNSIVFQIMNKFVVTNMIKCFIKFHNI